MSILLPAVLREFADRNSGVVRGLRLEGRTRIDAGSVTHRDP
jgi:hypothetical protein